METARRILVVDDSEEVRDYFQVALRLAGYVVETAEDGADALAKVIRDRPDLILLDVVMPRMDGLELLVKLRSDLAPPVPPAILVSGFDMTEEEALRRGAVRFLQKPLDAQDLVAAVADVLAGRSAAEEAIERARERAGAARQEARQTAMKLMREIEAQAAPGAPPFSEQAARLVTFGAGYLAVDVMVVAMLREDRLRVLASSNPSLIASDLDLTEAFPIVERVLESRSSLVLPDLSIHPSFSRFARRLDELHCLIAVPLLFDGRAIGVVCSFQMCSCAVEGDDLALLQLFSSRGTSLLQAWASGRSEDEPSLRFGPGIVPRRAFESLLDLELRRLRARGGSLELAVVSAAEVSSVQTAVATATNRARLIAGALGDHRIALFKSDARGGARAALAAVLAPLCQQAAVRMGIVDLTDGVFSSLHASDLLRLAEQALDEAAEAAGTVRRMVVEMQDA
jgi:CheY-like chemotaxis protein